MCTRSSDMKPPLTLSLKLLWLCLILKNVTKSHGSITHKILSLELKDPEIHRLYLKSCRYKSRFWDISIDETDTLFPSFSGWIPYVTQSYLHHFPIDDDVTQTIKVVNNVLFSSVTPQSFSSQSRLVAISEDTMQKLLDLNPMVAKCPLFLKFVSAESSSLFPVALAHRYGGHQFGYWAGQLGDGRAAILGSFTNSARIISELNLKGSGVTPYSRQGDGRAVLRSSIREFLASEAMYHLGVPTSRALSLIVSDDEVVRDEFYNGQMKAERGAMVLRVAPSWFRIGSLEILAYSGELQLLRSLLDYFIEHHYKHMISVDDDNKYLMLFEEIVSGTAHMIAGWQSLGFAHGVCNTDNFSLLSITIDYGPFGFLDEYNPNFVPNFSDDEGRYSYRKQPSVGYYNMDKLRIALNPLFTDNQKRVSRFILDGYYDIFNTTMYQRFAQKLGIPAVYAANSKGIIDLFLKILKDTHADFTMSFRQLGEVHIVDLTGNCFKDSLWALSDVSTHSKFHKFVKKYTQYLWTIGVSDEERRKLMCSVNPVYVLRNWMAQNAIQKAYENDFSEVRKLLRVLNAPYKRQVEGESAHYSSRPPPWAQSLKVSCSS